MRSVAFPPRRHVGSETATPPLSPSDVRTAGSSRWLSRSELDVKDGSGGVDLEFTNAAPTPSRSQRTNASGDSIACDGHGYAVSPARLIALLWRYNNMCGNSDPSENKKSHDNFWRGGGHPFSHSPSRCISSRTPGIRSHGIRSRYGSRCGSRCGSHMAILAVAMGLRCSKAKANLERELEEREAALAQAKAENSELRAKLEESEAALALAKAKLKERETALALANVD